MVRGPVVGSRELKTHLGRYLQRVRRGEVVLVTDRDEPVAELRPVGAADATRRAPLQSAASGAVTLPEATTLKSCPAIRPRRGRHGAALVRLDRDERG